MTAYMEELFGDSYIVQLTMSRINSSLGALNMYNHRNEKGATLMRRDGTFQSIQKQYIYQ